MQAEERPAERGGDWVCGYCGDVGYGHQKHSYFLGFINGKAVPFHPLCVLRISRRREEGLRRAMRRAEVAR